MLLALFALGAVAACEAPTDVPGPGEDEEYEEPGGGDNPTVVTFGSLSVFV